jgi:hypothetical protein
MGPILARVVSFLSSLACTKRRSGRHSRKEGTRRVGSPVAVGWEEGDVFGSGSGSDWTEVRWDGRGERTNDAAIPPDRRPLQSADSSSSYCRFPPLAGDCIFRHPPLSDFLCSHFSGGQARK